MNNRQHQESPVAQQSSATLFGNLADASSDDLINIFFIGSLTPLTGCKGLVTLLLGYSPNQLTVQQQEMLENMQTYIDHLILVRKELAAECSRRASELV